jgi:hypothetical protein
MKYEDVVNKLLPFAKHTYNCESLEPMWHKGPCSCGFADLVVQLRGHGYNIVDGSLYETTPQPPRLRPGLLESVANGRRSLGMCGEAGKPESIELLHVEMRDDVRIVVCRRLSDGVEFRYTLPKR